MSKLTVTAYTTLDNVRRGSALDQARATAGGEDVVMTHLTSRVGAER